MRLVFPLIPSLLRSAGAVRATFPALCALVLGAGTVLMTAPAAHAQSLQVTFSLTPASVNYTPSASSQTILFSGKISNLSSSTIFLNDIGIVLTPASSTFAAPNTDVFFANTPLSLDPVGTAGGTDQYSGLVFGIDLGATNVNPQSFFGTVTLRGGTTDTSLSTLGTPQQFSGAPTITASAAPEPGSIALAAFGLLSASGTALARRRRRCRHHG